VSGHLHSVATIAPIASDAGWMPGQSGYGSFEKYPLLLKKINTDH
jgi:hypothetical protein